MSDTFRPPVWLDPDQIWNNSEGRWWVASREKNGEINLVSLENPPRPPRRVSPNELVTQFQPIPLVQEEWITEKILEREG